MSTVEPSSETAIFVIVLSVGMSISSDINVLFFLYVIYDGPFVSVYVKNYPVYREREHCNILK